MISTHLVKYVMTAALRDRVLISLLALVVVGICLSVFLGSAAVTETDQFSLVFSAGSLRIIGVTALVLFIVFYVRRSFESKDVDFLLARPITRPGFILSHALAFSLLAALVALIIIAGFSLVLPQSFSYGHLLWSASFLAELIIMANVAMFFAMVMSSATASALIVFALYVLARLMGLLLGIVDAPGPSWEIWLGYIFQVTSLIVPRLDLFGQTAWLIYEPADAIGFGFILAQCVIYSFLVILAAMIDLVRRQF